jgi:hypothetical protein
MLRFSPKSRQLFHVLLLNTKEFKLRKHVGELVWALRPNTRGEIFKRNKASRMIPVFLTVNLKLIWRRIQSGQKGHVFQRDVMENTNCLANIIGRRAAAGCVWWLILSPGLTGFYIHIHHHNIMKKVERKKKTCSIYPIIHWREESKRDEWS